MIRCLAPNFDMLRSLLADRLEPRAPIIQNDSHHRVLSVQTMKHPRPRCRKTIAAGASNTVKAVLKAMTASPAIALSP